MWSQCRNPNLPSHIVWSNITSNYNTVSEKAFMPSDSKARLPCTSSSLLASFDSLLWTWELAHRSFISSLSQVTCSIMSVVDDIGCWRSCLLTVRARRKICCQRMEAHLLEKSGAILQFKLAQINYLSFALAVWYWQLSNYMLIFQPYPLHTIRNSMQPLHGLSHSKIVQHLLCNPSFLSYANEWSNMCVFTFWFSEKGRICWSLLTKEGLQ